MRSGVTVRLNCRPGSITPESTPPERAVTVWGAVSSLSNTTVAPLATVRVPGTKASPAIRTVPPAPPPAASAPGWAPSAALGAATRSASRSRTMTTGPARARLTIATTTSSHTGLGRGAAARRMPRFYSNPRRAANPARIIQTTRAMATVSRNRYIGRP